MNDSLKLDMFFPGELLSITSVDHDDSSIHIKMRSKTHSSKCPECGQEGCIYKVSGANKNFINSMKKVAMELIMW